MALLRKLNGLINYASFDLSITVLEHSLLFRQLVQSVHTAFNSCSKALMVFSCKICPTLSVLCPADKMHSYVVRSLLVINII